MDFKKLSERELLQAYRGYKKLATTGTVGEDDFGGVFRRAIDECDSDIGVKVTDTIMALLQELSERWFQEHDLVDSMLTVGKTLWYANKETGEVERAVVESVNYENGKLESFGANFPESNDWDLFFGSALGDVFFQSEAQAKMYLEDDKKEDEKR